MSKPLHRLATIEDLDQLVGLRVSMQMEVNGSRVPELPAGYRESVRRYFARSLADGSYVSAVTEVEGQLVAAGGLIVYSKPPSVTGGAGRLGYVSNVYTLPEWRRRGIAGEVMKLLIEHARRTGVDYLHLGATDLGKGIYERLGFKPPRTPQLELRL